MQEELKQECKTLNDDTKELSEDVLEKINGGLLANNFIVYSGPIKEEIIKKLNSINISKGKVYASGCVDSLMLDDNDIDKKTFLV